MRASFVSIVAAALAAAALVSAALPDTINVNVRNLGPEDSVFDRTRSVFYQSNLYKGSIEVYDPRRRSHFNVRIDGVSSDGSGDQQMSGLSLSTHDNAKYLYAVCKNSKSFDFSNQKSHGANSFHRFSLPLSPQSKPDWSVDLSKAQDQWEHKTGTRPFGSVQSAQDSDGNSYVVFELGMAAITKIDSSGKKIEAWAHEKGADSQRPGYSGITFDPSTNRIIAFGGPRPLTAFDVKSQNPKPQPVKINGDFGSLEGTEKIVTIPRGTNQVLVGARAPNAISFFTRDNWKSDDMHMTKRNELQNSGFTAVTDYYQGAEQGIYASSAYFQNGAHGGRDNYPLYKLDASILDF